MIISLSYLFHPLSFETVTLRHLIIYINITNMVGKCFHSSFLFISTFYQRWIFCLNYQGSTAVGLSNRVRVTQLSRCKHPFLHFIFPRLYSSINLLNVWLYMKPDWINKYLRITTRHKFEAMTQRLFNLISIFGRLLVLGQYQFCQKFPKCP